MKATVDAKEFSNALSRVSRVVSKSCVPALEGILLQFDGEHCTLTATDLDVWLSMTVPARGDAFSCIVGQTKQAVRSCRYLDGNLTLELIEHRKEHEPDRLCLSCGSRSGEFTAMAAKEFPSIPELGDKVLFQTGADVLLKRIDRVRYAAAKTGDDSREARYCIQFSGPHIYAVDGYRLACDTDETISVSFPLLVRASSLAHLKHLGNQQITVHRGTQCLQFVSETMQLQCRMANDLPLDLDRAVPTRFQEEFYICTEEFLRELNYLKAFVTAKPSALVRFDGGTLSLDGRSNCRTAVSISLEEGQHCMIPVGFNLDYMADAVNQFGGVPRLKMKITSATGPIILEAEGRSDYAFVMPVRLKEHQAAA